MPKLKPGALVRPTSAALNSLAYGHNNQQFISKHGLLHVVIAAPEGERQLRLKSLASGHEHRFFFRDEVETAEEAASDAEA